MASPPPTPYGAPPRPMAWQSPGSIAAIIIAVVFGIFFLAIFTAMTGLSGGPFGFSTFLFAPVCGFILIILVIVVVMASQGASRAPIPPPPPIQQPMVPAGQVGPIALNCPNCGAPPQNVDRFGVATCTYCGTRFLVR